MRPRSQDEKKDFVAAPAGIPVEISGGRTVTVLMVSPARISETIEAIGRASGIPSYYEEDEAEEAEPDSVAVPKPSWADKKLRRRTADLGYYVILGMALYDADLMIETPDFDEASIPVGVEDDNGTPADKALKAYAEQVAAECESKAGRMLLGWKDIHAIVHAACSISTQADEEKKS